jgi:hypothetical protein
MKYVVRSIVGAFIGYLIGAVLNIALSHVFWDVFWPDLRNWTVFDFFGRPGELEGWSRFGLMFPVLAGCFAALPGIGWGILGSLGAAVVVGIIAFVVGFFVVIGWGGVLALLLFFGLIAGPVGGVIVLIFE